MLSRTRHQPNSSPLRRYILVVVSGMLMFSCNIKKDRSSSGYYPIDSLLKAQANALHRHRAEVSKTSSLSDVNETNTFHPKDIASWEKELAALMEIDAINRPTYNGLYQVDKGLADTRSNLKVDAFTAQGDLPVQSLRIYYQDSPAKVRKIEAVLKEENSLYTSKKFFELEFQDIDRQNILTAYTVEGEQKMYLKDSVHYKIAVAITLAN
ncbi:hypothetical protein [Pseudochryseolinea flava]|uniref:Lipoprotein n=1 Tax=Pseudochryseolinea flava TaxID=2059302 RepID=A0A364YB80_9BACT|nr:hypothetical protein [Pseudochryseolinea flava]RAW03068.1 hypothetical protein DQQ10_02925 [Pseudochryseolinea flava]